MQKAFVDRKIALLDWLLLALILPGILSGLFIAVRRHKVETRNSTVELVLDYAELQDISAASGAPITTLLQRFRSAGVTGVAINEEVLSNLTSEGRVSLFQRGTYSDPVTVIRVTDPKIAGRVFRAISVRMPSGVVVPDLSQIDPSRTSVIPYEVQVRAAPQTLTRMEIGLPPDAVRTIQNAGLDVVARIGNRASLTRESITATTLDLKRQNIKRVICSGEEVIGFRGLIKHAANAIKSAGLLYGSVEFAKQKGDADLSRALGSSLVRVHSIPSSEMAEMTLQEAVDRFVRAVKERNIRLCYIHLAETTGEDPIGRNTEFITAISTRIRSLGYTTGLSKPFEQLFRPKLMLVLMALSVVAGAVLALSRLISVSWLPRLVLVALGMLASVAILQMFGEIGKQLLAFAAALIYPVLSTVVLVVPLFNAELDYNLPELKAIGTLMAMSLISMCGGLLIVGFLADRAYMVKQSQFIGVRGAHVVPMIAVALLAISGLPILGKSVRAVWCDVKSTAAVVASRPLTLGQALVLIAVFAIVGLAVVRTTNEPAIDPFSAELRSRAILETALVVRPRAKEFLIGHPALLLGIALLATRRRDWALPLVVLGMLGQVSLVNSFCHIHTPLTVSISRTANGLVLGIIVGLVLWASFFERGLPSKQSLHRP